MTTPLNIRVTSTPDDDGPSWPMPPPYVPLYTVPELGALALYLADPPGRWMEFSNVLEVVGAYDKALAKALFRVWQLEGMARP